MIYPYLDDCLLRAFSVNEVCCVTKATKDLFIELGLQINAKKSTLALVKCLEFTGVDLDLLQAKVLLPHHRILSLATLIETVQNSPQISARHCIQLLGAYGNWHSGDTSCQASYVVSLDVVQLGLQTKQKQTRQTSLTAH